MTATGLGARYWKLWTSAGLSNLADGVMKVALPLVAIRYTDSPALIAGLSFAFTLPWLLFALTAGALADRFDRRRLMLVANTARAPSSSRCLTIVTHRGRRIDLAPLRRRALHRRRRDRLRHVVAVDPAAAGPPRPRSPARTDASTPPN